MADSDQVVGSLGITQRWKEFVAGFHARLFGAMLYTPNGDSMADDTADAVKTVLPNLEATDDGGVTLGTQKVVPMGMLADETTPDSVDEGDVGIPRMTLSRIPWAALRKKKSASADTEEEVNKPVTLLASAARTALATAAITNVNHKVLVLVIDVTARSAATTLTPKLTLKGPVTGTYDLDIWTAAAAIDTADATYAYVFAVGGIGSAGSYTEGVGMPVPDCQLTVTPNDANSVTYSVGAYWMV